MHDRSRSILLLICPTVLLASFVRTDILIYLVDMHVITRKRLNEFAEKFPETKMLWLIGIGK